VQRREVLGDGPVQWRSGFAAKLRQCYDSVDHLQLALIWRGPLKTHGFPFKVLPTY